MTDLLVASVQHNVPWAAKEQIRLFAQNLTDDHELVIVDNSTDHGAAGGIRDLCTDTGTAYLRVPGPAHEHPDGLNYAVSVFRSLDIHPDVPLVDSPDLRPLGPARYVGFVDHDLFPVAPASVIPWIRQAGFFGIGQRHAPTGSRYLKPSFAFFDREWLRGRPLNFTGIRAAEKADDGDCGSQLGPLFSDDDWTRMAVIEHGYKQVRDMDDHLQSWGVEVFGDAGEWVHLFNLSRWLAVRDPDGREALVREMVEAL